MPTAGFSTGAASRCLGDRIVTVVDVYDAMTHERPYKRAFREEEAVAYLDDNRGTLFDPPVVAAFLDRLAEVRQVEETVQDSAEEIDLEL